MGQAASVQNALDIAHSNKISKHTMEVAQLNQELRETLYPLVNEIKNILNDPELKDKPQDLTRLEGLINSFEEVYRQHRGEFKNHFPREADGLEQLEKGEARVFPDDLTEVTHQTMRKVESILDQLKNAHNDSVQQITNNLYLLGQLYVTLGQITQRMQRNDDEHKAHIVRNQVAR